MNVEDAPRKLLHEPRRKQPHVSRQAEQVNLVLLQHSHEFTIMFSPVLAFRRNDQRGEAETTGSFYPPCIRPIGNDYSDTSVGNLSGCDIPGNSFKIRTA